ncbi:MAG: ribose-5-phosphate isomerase [Candidatus Moraniibacteriota bacterium]|nr:MAG: ribose-5-phosphate isomerase [Candidatus Moranbacteria bacterium]
MKIYLGTDHAGFQYKEIVKEYLKNETKYEVIDEGVYEYVKTDDYPDVIVPVAKSISQNRKKDIESRGIIFGGSGQGEAIVANRFSGVRCAVYYGGPKKIVTLSREHNNANILSIGARFVAEEDVVEIVKLWLSTEFSGDARHVRRIRKIDKC